MKIVSWNCNGKFREKYGLIHSYYDADIYVIQECEDPASIKDNRHYQMLFQNGFWTGVQKNRGIGVFAKNHINLTKNDWKNYCLRNFISVRVNNSFDLLGVWACKPYIEEFYIYYTINSEFINKDTIIIGDFNSNAIWDKQHSDRNHSEVVRLLKKKELTSAYHSQLMERQGHETNPTFYLYRHSDKGYHIDYCFLNNNRLIGFYFGNKDEWLNISDHIPILIEI